MKRWPLRILLCLILGAITTVAVAWKCEWDRFAYGTQRTPGTDGMMASLPDWASVDPSYTMLVTESWIGRAARTDSYIFGDASLIEMDEDGSSAHWDDNFRSDIFVHHASGWPSTAMAASSFYANATKSLGQLRSAVLRAQDIVRDDFQATTTIQKHGIVLEDRSAELWRPVMLPLLPIWPGFMIDTLFYAAIWFGVFFGFASARRAIRRRRGRCPRCGYDLRGALENGCPECGWNRGDGKA